MEDTRSYVVVRNDEDQYSIWLATKKRPLGWEAVSEPLAKQAALDQIETVWTDMRPLSARCAP